MNNGRYYTTVTWRFYVLPSNNVTVLHIVTNYPRNPLSSIGPLFPFVVVQSETLKTNTTLKSDVKLFFSYPVLITLTNRSYGPPFSVVSGL